MSILSYFPQGGSGGDVLCFKSVIVNPSDWDDSVYDTNYPYEAVLILNGVTADHFPVVAFEDDDDANYVFLNIAQTCTDSITIYAKKAPTSLIIIPSITCYESTVSSGIGTLEETSWDVISAVAQSGKAGDFWDIGDTKSVVLNGTVGTLSLDTTLYVYIIGINHEGKNGITWQGFRTAATDGVDVVLIANDGTQPHNGTMAFNMNHWGTSTSPYNTNYGGWKGCDLRYDILGSTDTAPSGYGSTPVVDTRVGYDASSTTATNPVSNTLMAALPSTLRAVMKPMTVYTDNNSGSSHNTESYVTTSVDYLPLLAEFEVFGVRTYANEYEQNYQAQYAYYANGGSKIKYKHSATNITSVWWERSPSYGNAKYFCNVETSGSADIRYNDYSIGLSPIFLV